MTPPMLILAPYTPAERCEPRLIVPNSAITIPVVYVPFGLPLANVKCVESVTVIVDTEVPGLKDDPVT